ncbi:MAG TPA: LPS assembly lipoprotein LptE [Nitrospira sp.]|jgi:hypothetical protein|nr:hypothetical protein [Nitrospira sp.]MCC7472216.1 hypothetical protein [Candidatus Nomurabacteria bacterium]HNL89894.1 LPS assembly lipoprotein LptE [Nitrospira sp.]
MACALAMSLSLSACGYQFRVQGAGPTVGGAPETTTKRTQTPRLAILPISNTTYEPNFEIKLANYLRREFSAGAGAEIVGPSAGADLFLSGQIMQILLPTLSFDQTTTFESRVEMLVSVKIEDAKTKRVVWSQVAKGTSEFFLTQDLQFNRVLQNRALEQAGRFVAEDLASRFLLFLDAGELDKVLKRPVKAEAGQGNPPQPESVR